MARPDFRAAAAARLSEERELSPAIVSLISPEAGKRTSIRQLPLDLNFFRGVGGALRPKVSIALGAAIVVYGNKTDALGQAVPDSEQSGGVTTRYGEPTQVSAFDGVTTNLTEMDALVAYLQTRGRAKDWRPDNDYEK